MVDDLDDDVEMTGYRRTRTHWDNRDSLVGGGRKHVQDSSMVYLWLSRWWRVKQKQKKNLEEYEDEMRCRSTWLQDDELEGLWH